MDNCLPLDYWTLYIDNLTNVHFLEGITFVSIDKYNIICVDYTI